MNLEDTKAPRRPKLTLPFGRTRTEPSTSAPGLSGGELRTIVAAMIG